jgi:hypothetical protein
MKTIESAEVVGQRIERDLTVQTTLPIIRQALSGRRRTLKDLVLLAVYVGTEVFKSNPKPKAVETILARLTLLAGPGADLSKVGDIAKDANGNVVFILVSQNGAECNEITPCSTNDGPELLRLDLTPHDHETMPVVGISCSCTRHYPSNSLTLGSAL